MPPRRAHRRRDPPVHACAAAGDLGQRPPRRRTDATSPNNFRWRRLLPGGAVTGPVDTTAAVSAEGFRRCTELLAADDGVDAMIALVQPTGATGDLIAAIQAAGVGVPLAAVELDQAESVG